MIMKNLLNKKLNEHEIQAVTISYHSEKLGVSIFLQKVLSLWLLFSIFCEG